MNNLHVYHDGEADWFVATSPEDAAEQQRAFTGLLIEDQEWEFEQCPDSKPLTIWVDRWGDPAEIDSEESERVTLTCGKWAALQGRGFLCSTEY